ncbi:MAG: Hint domain-containing protein, partial [Actinomycetota bacterium]|nr:Hint domain-containing protein [Actinomycetota bacterium]
AEAIGAVLVHHDTNRYDLTIRANGRTGVIGTTSNHPFWDATTRRWVKAAALKYGTHLRTPAGSTATVVSGYAPEDRSGWMWDLTIPGDHDFYIDTAAADILVHNCVIDPSTVRYSQDSATFRFGNGSTISDTAQGLREGTIDPESIPPIRLVERDGNLFTLDNRRLVAFQDAGVEVPYRMATEREIGREAFKFSTQNGGTSIQLALFGRGGL